MKTTRDTPAVVVKTDDEMVNELKEKKEELKVRNESLEKEIREVKTEKEEMMKQVEQLQLQVKDLNQELRARVSADEMAKIKRILVTLQQVGIAVDFNETSELPIPKTEAILLEKIHHLETGNSELRSTFNDIYNKYMTSENKRHEMEEQLSDARDAMEKMEGQIAELEQRVIGDIGGERGNVEKILKDQRDRYKRRVDELEVDVKLENDG